MPQSASPKRGGAVSVTAILVWWDGSSFNRTPGTYLTDAPLNSFTEFRHSAADRRRRDMLRSSGGGAAVSAALTAERFDASAAWFVFAKGRRGPPTIG